MKLPLWQLDAFTSRRFAGNPAAVVPLSAWLPDPVMQAIAAENNLPETAFLLRQETDYAIRWFTPTVEVPLCGHATLASGWVVLNRLEPQRERVDFHSKSGILQVERDGERLALDFPSVPVRPIPAAAALTEALGLAPRALFEGGMHLALYGSEEEVRMLSPDLSALGRVDLHGLIATAPGRDCDFVSRFFWPAGGIPEDPVTGAAHCRLVPFWSQRLGNVSLFARQVSARGGELWCELRGTRVRMAGHAALYLEGAIEV